MNTVQITWANARTAYNKADQNGKQMLVNLFGKKVFNENKTEYIKTFDDVCSELGIEPGSYRVEANAPAIDRAHMHLERLLLIAKVFNEDWKPNLADTTQYKYYPWFKFIPDTNKPSGFGLSYYGYVFVNARTSLGSRPYFKDGDTAKYVGIQFIGEYEAWMQALNDAF